jgi:hypothetical protein
MGHLWTDRSWWGGKMMNMPDAISVFGFHFFKLCLLFRGKKGDDFGVGFRDTIHCTAGRLAMNRFPVDAGSFDQGSYHLPAIKLASENVSPQAFSI